MKMVLSASNCILHFASSIYIKHISSVIQNIM